MMAACGGKGTVRDWSATVSCSTVDISQIQGSNPLFENNTARNTQSLMVNPATSKAGNCDNAAMFSEYRQPLSEEETSAKSDEESCIVMGSDDERDGSASSKDVNRHEPKSIERRNELPKVILQKVSSPSPSKEPDWITISTNSVPTTVLAKYAPKPPPPPCPLPPPPPVLASASLSLSQPLPQSLTPTQPQRSVLTQQKLPPKLLQSVPLIKLSQLTQSETQTTRAVVKNSIKEDSSFGSEPAGALVVEIAVANASEEAMAKAIKQDAIEIMASNFSKPQTQESLRKGGNSKPSASCSEGTKGQELAPADSDEVELVETSEADDGQNREHVKEFLHEASSATFLSQMKFFGGRTWRGRGRGKKRGRGRGRQEDKEATNIALKLIESDVESLVDRGEAVDPSPGRNSVDLAGTSQDNEPVVTLSESPDTLTTNVVTPSARGRGKSRGRPRGQSSAARRLPMTDSEKITYQSSDSLSNQLLSSQSQKEPENRVLQESAKKTPAPQRQRGYRGRRRKGRRIRKSDMVAAQDLITPDIASSNGIDTTEETNAESGLNDEDSLAAIKATLSELRKRKDSDKHASSGATVVATAAEDVHGVTMASEAETPLQPAHSSQTKRGRKRGRGRPPSKGTVKGSQSRSIAPLVDGSSVEANMDENEVGSAGERASLAAAAAEKEVVLATLATVAMEEPVLHGSTLGQGLKLKIHPMQGKGSGMAPGPVLEEQLPVYTSYPRKRNRLQVPDVPDLPPVVSDLLPVVPDLPAVLETPTRGSRKRQAAARLSPDMMTKKSVAERQVTNAPQIETNITPANMDPVTVVPPVVSKKQGKRGRRKKKKNGPAAKGQGLAAASQEVLVTKVEEAALVTLSEKEDASARTGLYHSKERSKSPVLCLRKISPMGDGTEPTSLPKPQASKSRVAEEVVTPIPSGSKTNEGDQESRQAAASDKVMYIDLTSTQENEVQRSPQVTVWSQMAEKQQGTSRSIPDVNSLLTSPASKKESLTKSVGAMMSHLFGDNLSELCPEGFVLNVRMEVETKKNGNTVSHTSEPCCKNSQDTCPCLQKLSPVDLLNIVHRQVERQQDRDRTARSAMLAMIKDLILELKVKPS